jgi:hypothetical protein
VPGTVACHSFEQTAQTHANSHCPERLCLANRKAKNAVPAPRGTEERLIALNLGNPFRIFFEAASFVGKKAFDSRLVGLILFAALLRVLGDLGT